MVKNLIPKNDVNLKVGLIWKQSGSYRVDCPKYALSSQTKKIMLTTTFPHSLGPKHCKKPNFENFHAYFRLAQAFQSFTT